VHFLNESCIAVLLSAGILVQHALHRLEQQAGLAAGGYIISGALQDPFTAAFDSRMRMLALASPSGSDSLGESTRHPGRLALVAKLRGIELNRKLRTDVPKMSTASLEPKPTQARFRTQKPASLSNLRFPAAKHGHDGSRSKACRSPISDTGAIHEDQMFSPCAALLSPFGCRSPGSPTVEHGHNISKSERSPFLLAVEHGFRKLISSGGKVSPSVSSFKRAHNKLDSPGIQVAQSISSMQVGFKSPRSPLSQAPRTPKRLAGFAIPKKGLKSVLSSPRKSKFDSGSPRASPRKAHFDDEGFDDTL
jgi:hypothetical protein